MKYVIYKISINFQVVIPTPITASKRVLIMSCIPGMKLVDALQEHLKRISELTGMSVQELRLLSRKNLSDSEEDDMTSVMRNTSQYIYQTSFFWHNIGVSVYNASAYVINNTAWWIGLDETAAKDELEKGTIIRYADTATVPPVIDLEDLLHTLFQVHGHQIFHDGAFNGDPHPGTYIHTYKHMYIYNLSFEK